MVSVAAEVGELLLVKVDAGVSTASTGVGVGSALSVAAANVAARPTSTVAVSATGAAVGCARKGRGMQALRIKAVTKTKTAVLFMTSSLHLLDDL
jgi:hypothetical protein